MLLNTLILIPPALQESPHLGEHPAFRIDAHIGAVRLEQLGREPETGFAGAGRADDTGVEVAGVGGIFGPGVHGEKLRLCQNDVVLKLRIDKGLDVFFGAPAGRPVFLIPPEFLCVLAFEVDQQAKAHRAHNTDEPVKGGQPRRKVGKGRADALPQAHELVSKVCSRGQAVGRPQL